MSDDPNTQAVVDETKTPAQPGAAVEDAREVDDLDKLLSEYGERPKPSPTQPERADTDEASKLLAIQMEIDGLKRFVSADKEAAESAKVMKDIRGDADSDIFTDGMILGWINGHPNSKTINEVWKNRENDPASAKRMIAGLKREFEKGPPSRLKELPDRNATEDRSAVTAAVRGASTKAPEGKAPDFKGMSDAEFRESVKKDYGFTPI